jgi:peptidyl-prolyl cis-trans isomerase SurA
VTTASVRKFLLILCLLGASAHAFAQDDEIVILDRIVALVNDGIILESDLHAELDNVVVELRRMKRKIPPPDVLRKQVLERLIVAQTQLQRAKQLGIEVTDAQINESTTRIAKNNRMTLSEFRKTLLAEGYDYLKFRSDLHRDLVIQQLRRREVEKRINISEQEINEHLAVNRQETRKSVQHHLRHIFISVTEGADPDTLAAERKHAEEVRVQLVQGADFAALAARLSDGQNALEGGDLGWRTFAQMPARFAVAVEEMKVGDVSQPIRSNVGFHLLKLEAVRGEQRHMVAQTQARHILLSTHAVRDHGAARQMLGELRERAAAGESFAELARTYSEDHATASEGGDLGWFSKGAMEPAFEAALANLQPGDISQPFQTSLGWHIAQLLQRRKADDTETFLRSQARQQLWQIKVEDETRLWLRRLRDEAYVEYIEPS